MVDAALAHLQGADVVAVLTRAPSAGGKTRLFAELARPCDPTLLEALLLDTLDAVKASAGRGVLYVEPASSLPEVRALVPGMPIVAQSSGSLGERMRMCMASLFEAGARRVALIGSDLPTLTPALIDAAFDALERHPQYLVLGPAVDGGYFLLAAAAVPPVFDGIEWGTSRVCAQTMSAAAAAGWSALRLPELDDVDDAEGLERAVRAGAGRTAAWARTHLGRRSQL